MTDAPPARVPIEARLRAAGLPPLPRTAWLEIDLDALAGNLATLRAKVPPGTQVIAVVKADAYGHGAVPVARALEAAGVDGLALAVVDEAVELRSAGIGVPLVVLYPAPQEMVPIAASERIELTIGDADTAGPILAAAGESGLEAPLGVHVELETGLGRGGTSGHELSRLLATIAANPNVWLAGVWSHLTAGEDVERTSSQVQAFAAAMGLPAGPRPAPRRHLAASAGVLAGTAPAFDAIRPGLSIYGIAPEELGEGAGLAAGLRPVMSLFARPVRVAELPAGHGIGYGPAFTTNRVSRIATLPVGYGDGYARTMSHRVSALVRGVRAPIVGTIAMDGLMVDVTDVPGGPVTIDDEFVLLGRQGAETIDARDLAQSRTTISWEVVTAMSARLPRVYHAAAGLLACRTLAGETGRSWRTSNSGTATSATWRSTRS